MKNRTIAFDLGGVCASVELGFNNTRQWAFHVKPTETLDVQNWEKITANRVLLAACVFGAYSECDTITYFMQTERDNADALFGTESADVAAIALAEYVYTLIGHEYDPLVTADVLAQTKASADEACAKANWSVFQTLMSDGYPYHEQYMNCLYDFANQASVWITPNKF